MKSALRHFYAVVLAAMREIFDESAYARFLAEEGLAPSRRAYQLFLRESAAQRQRRPRCC